MYLTLFDRYDLKQRAIIVPDANVLLSLYESERGTRDLIQDNLNLAIDRICVTPRVRREVLQNLLRVKSAMRIAMPKIELAMRKHIEKSARSLRMRGDIPRHIDVGETFLAACEKAGVLSLL